jgi:ubiquinone/menaquinone biosynthesis C-methylase UbiE
MGFFSLDTARLLGPEGRLVCVDVQARMIEVLRKRAAKAGLSDRIDARVCSTDSLGIDDLTDQLDLALVIATAHEVPDREGLFAQIGACMRPGGKLLVGEPKSHVKQELFDTIEKAAAAAGFELIERPRMFRSHTALMGKS